MLKTLLAIIAYWFIRILTALYRYKLYDRHHTILLEEEGTPILHAFYHGKQLALFGYPMPKPMVLMISKSKDGDLQNEIVRFFGFQTVRGSSGKDGEKALVEMSDFVIHTCNASLTVDGSRGPLHSVKSGILHLARDTGGAIVPLAVASKPKIVLEQAWDKYEIPLPWARVVVMQAEPLFIDGEIDDEGLELKRKKLKERLDALQEEAEAKLLELTEKKQEKKDETSEATKPPKEEENESEQQRKRESIEMADAAEIMKDNTKP